MIKKKFNRILLTFLLCFILAIGGCFLLSTTKKIQTTTQYLQSPDLRIAFLSFYHEFYTNNLTTSMYDDTISSLEELENKSDYIFLAKPIQRFQPSGQFVTQMQIISTYKGDYDQEQFYLFEPVSLGNDELVTLKIPMGWYIPVRDNQEYLLFLNKEENYQRDDLFQLTTNLYSKIDTKQNMTVGHLDNEDSVVFLFKGTYDRFDIAFPTNFISDSSVDGSFIYDTYIHIIEEAHQKYLNQDVSFQGIEVQNEKDITN